VCRYRNCADEECGPAILIIRDSGGKVFGAFASHSFEVVAHYFGNGYTFLWRREGSRVSVARASGRNDYYILSDKHELAFGGGSTGFGLYLDENLLRGHTGTCETFEDWTGTGSFVVNDVEVWQFLYE
jgi:hypothetical protein